MEYCYHVLAGYVWDTGPTFAYFLGTIIENSPLRKLNDIIIFISLCNQNIGIC